MAAAPKQKKTAWLSQGAISAVETYRYANRLPSFGAAVDAMLLKATPPASEVFDEPCIMRHVENYDLRMGLLDPELLPQETNWRVWLLFSVGVVVALIAGIAIGRGLN